MDIYGASGVESVVFGCGDDRFEGLLAVRNATVFNLGAPYRQLG